MALTRDTGGGDSYYDDDGVYGICDSIEVTVTFSENVSVIGKPRLGLDIGGASKSAEYERAGGSTVMFNYMVAEGDADSNGISLKADKLTLHGGSIKDSANNVAILTHNALPAQEDHRVDGIRPAVSRIYLPTLTTTGQNGFYTVGDQIFVYVEFSESARISGRPQLTLDFDGTAKTSESIVGVSPRCARYQDAQDNWRHAARLEPRVPSVFDRHCGVLGCIDAIDLWKCQLTTRSGATPASHALGSSHPEGICLRNSFELCLLPVRDAGMSKFLPAEQLVSKHQYKAANSPRRQKAKLNSTTSKQRSFATCGKH